MLGQYLIVGFVVVSIVTIVITPRIHTELYANGETQWLKFTDIAENSCLQVQLIGNATQFQIKTNDMCVVLQKYYWAGDYKWLALGPCGTYKPIYFTITP